MLFPPCRGLLNTVLYNKGMVVFSEYLFIYFYKLFISDIHRSDELDVLHFYLCGIIVYITHQVYDLLYIDDYNK